MAWRKIQYDDIVRGTCVRFSGMKDTCYNGATIIAIESNPDSALNSNPINDIIYFARPFAYASDNYDCKQPILSAEQFSMTRYRLLSDSSDVEVYINRDGTCSKMLT